MSYRVGGVKGQFELPAQVERGSLSAEPSLESQDVETGLESQDLVDVKGNSSHSYVANESPTFLPGPSLDKEVVSELHTIRPSELLRRGLDRVVSRLEAYEKDGDLSPDTYWNENNPVEVEYRRGRSVNVDRTSALGGAQTTVTHTRHTGIDSVESTSSSGVKLPSESPVDGWSRPVSVTFAEWWVGSSEGKGIRADASSSVEGHLGKASTRLTAYAETRTNVGAGGRVNASGVEGGVWARKRAVVAGAQATTEIRTGSATIAGKEVNVGLVAKAQPFLGVEASSYAWVDVNARTAKASVSVGGELFAGARARAHVGFDVANGELFSARVTGDAWAGVGVDGGLSASYSKGRFSIGASAGAGLGIGGKVGFEMSVNVKGMAEMAYQAADRDGDGKLRLRDVATGMSQGLSVVASGVEKASDGFISALDGNGDGKFSPMDLQIRMSQAERTLTEGAAAIAEGVGQGIRTAGALVKSAADRDGDGTVGLKDISAGLEQAGEAVSSLGKGLVNGVEQVGAVSAALGRGVVADVKSVAGAVGDGLKASGEAIHSAMDRDGDGSLGLSDVGEGVREMGQALSSASQATASALSSATQSLASSASHGARSIGRGASAVGEMVVNGAKAAGAGIVEGMQEGAEAIHRGMDRDQDGVLGFGDLQAGAQQAGDAIVAGVESVGESIRSAGSAVAQGASNLAQGASNLASAAKDEMVEVGSRLIEGGESAYQRTKAAIRRVGDFLGFFDH